MTTTLAAQPYRLAYRHAARGRLGDLLTVDLRLMLTGTGYTPAATDEWLATPAAAEVSGAGYTAGGNPLVGRSVEDEDPGRTVLRCEPPVFANTGITCRWGVLYRATGDPATSPLLSYVDFGAVIDPAGANLEITFTAGAFRLGQVGVALP